MDVRLDGRVDPARSPERQADEPEHVERRQPGDDDADAPHPQEPVLERGPEDLVLAEEAGERRDTRDRDGADEHRPVRDRDLPPEAAHPAHVLLLVDRVDDRAGVEEQQALEKAVGHEVEDRRRPGADPERGEHVAELAQRRIREDALDVGLRQRDRRREDCREDPDPGDDDHRLRCVPEERVHAGDEVDAGINHRRRVDERGDGRRALHRVGQPDVERELRALAGGAAEHEERDQDDEPVVRRVDLREPFEGIVDVQGLGVHPDCGEPEREPDVAHAVDEERLLRPERGAPAPVPEADERVAAEPDELPAREHHEEVVRQDQQEHREHEQVEVREEAPVPAVVGHVADRVHVHEHPDRRDDDEEAGRQLVDVEADVDAERAGRDPAPERHRGAALAEPAGERGDGDGRGNEPREDDRADRDEAGGRAAVGVLDPPPEERREREAGDRQGDDEGHELGHLGVDRRYWRIASYSSTSGVRRFR